MLGVEKDDKWVWGITLKIYYFNGMLLYKAMYNLVMLPTK